MSTEKVDALVNMLGELVIIQSMLGELGQNFDMDRIDELKDGLGQLERSTRELQGSVMHIRMLPISVVFNRVPRLIHDLSQKLNKKVALEMTGTQTELDKTVLEKIGDPLVHLVRNSLDYGIENPEDRIKAGKSETGHVYLDAYNKGGNIIIEIRDDGAGINPERIINKAREKNLIAEDATLTPEQAYQYIFHPGFSTAEVVSDVSGRGVGMDVVNKNIKTLGGHVNVTSELGKGTTFTVQLPLTMAILDGQLLSVGSQTYIIQLISIVESIQIKNELIKHVVGKAELYLLRNEYIPIIRLHELFGVPDGRTELVKGLLVVVESGSEKVGLFVDELLGQQQVVIKSLAANYKPVKGVSGATILGDGTVSLILDVGELVGLTRDMGNIKQLMDKDFDRHRAA